MVEPIEETALERNHIVGKLNYSTVEKCKVMEFDTHFDFPVVGQTHTLYIAKKENVLYRWDDTELLYFACVGTDYNEIELINGGKADG